MLEKLLATLWRGKRFEGDAGVNLWLLRRRPLELVRFAVAPGASRAGITSVQLDYALPANPRPLWPIRAELRSLAPGLYLGRMDYLIGDRPRPVLYFTLEH